MPDYCGLTASSDIHRRRVQSLDPLHADSSCALLPEMNARADLSALAGTVRQLLPAEADLARFTPDEALAAMRDIGIFLGSIRRHGQDPLALLPQAQHVLVALGVRTSLVPRDTVHHYTWWNPEDHRRRMYVGDRQERILQDSVRRVLPQLSTAVHLCAKLRDLDPTQPSFASSATALESEVRPLVDTIELVVTAISPRFFARVLRPYFEGFDVDGRHYLGPAAAQVPLWLIDEAVWASDRNGSGYQDFLTHSAQYSLPEWRDLHSRWSCEPSLVTRIIDAYGPDCWSAPTITPELRRGSQAVANILRTLLVFRGRHLTVTRQAYHEELRLYSTGSGGGDVNLLKQITDLTRENARLMKKLG